MSDTDQRTANATESCDVVVVGAGISGLYAVHRLRSLGLSVICFERGAGVGGTWFWNRYPGARCDVPSMFYSYSFDADLEQEWEWSERFPAQPELLRYLNHVADRFDLRRDIRLETSVTGGTWDEAAGRWLVTTDRGERVSAQHLVAASGNLSKPNRPDFEGLDDFAGVWHHTAAWPEGGVDLAGKRVAVIGTGSTGVQIVPQLAQQAAHLTVLQRTANHAASAMNRPLDAQDQAAVKRRYREFRQASRESAFGIALEMTPGEPWETGPRYPSVFDFSEDEARAIMEERWAFGGGMALQNAFADIMVDLKANEVVAGFVRDKIDEIVEDPETAELLYPSGHPFGSKRLCVEMGYYETFNRENVSLVDVRKTPIERITRDGVRLRDGREIELDVIVFATGFDAITGALLRLELTGRDGLTLREKWSDGPRTYLGLMTSGFPNLFTVTGPNSPSVLSNMMTSIEQHVEWIADTIADLRERGVATLEATPEAEEIWTEHCTAVVAGTVLPLANSWWLGKNIPGKPTVFMPYAGGVGVYRRQCDTVRANGYEGFAVDGEVVPLAGEEGSAVAIAKDALALA